MSAFSRITTMINGVEIYVRNAVAMWTAMLPDGHVDRRLLRVDRPTGTRVILREPLESLESHACFEIARISPAVPLVVEDVFGNLNPSPLTPASRMLRMPVMNRPAGMVDSASPGVRVVEVADQDTLAEAEHVMVDGFPFPSYQPWIRGQALPPRVLELPGWRVWLAYSRDAPAAAAYTYDDGDATGVYWLATLPSHRTHGLARAVMKTAIAARPDHEFTLVATEAGRPLYEALGFSTVAMATWHTRPPIDGQTGSA